MYLKNLKNKQFFIKTDKRYVVYTLYCINIHLFYVLLNVLRTLQYFSTTFNKYNIIFTTISIRIT